MRFLLVTILVIICAVATTRAINPGVKVRFTKKGLDVANAWAQEALRRELTSLKIPDQSEGGRLTWWLRNINIRWVKVPTSRIALDPANNGLSVTLTNLGISLKANWRVRYKRGWFKFSTSGNVDLTAKGVNAAVRLRLGTGSDGRPTLTTAQCSEHISDIGVRFYGSLSSWILNRFRGKIGQKIRDKISGKICSAVRKIVLVDVPPKLRTLRVSTTIKDDFTLDYRLVEAPAVKTNYMDIPLKGTVYWKQNKSEPPITPKQIPASGDVSKMLYIWLTDYTLNTLGQAAYLHDKLVWDVAFDNIGDGITKAVATLRITSAPKVSITPGRCSLSIQGLVDAQATIDSIKQSLLTLNLNIDLTLQAQLQGDRLTASISNHSLTIDNFQLFGGIPIDTNDLNQMLDAALKAQVFPKLNEFGRSGVALPVSGDLKFFNSKLEFVQGAMMVATDVKYNERSQTAVPLGLPIPGRLPPMLPDDEDNLHRRLLHEP